MTTNSNGCSNTEILNLTIDYTVSNTNTQTACDSYVWPVNGQTYTTSGIYTDVTTNVNGCTVTETLDLTVNTSTTSTTTIVSCSNYTWSVNGQTYTTSGSYTDVSTNSNGCINTEILNLTITQANTFSQTEVVCDTFTWVVNGQDYINSGQYTVLSTNPISGCVDTNFLNLTINNSTYNTVSETSCDSYTWPVNGQLYSSSGTYNELSINSLGCQHTETLQLTINLSTTNTTFLNECDSYTWPINGQTYTEDGLYTQTSINSDGCIHTELLSLTVNQSSSNTISETSCGTYTWSANGQNYQNSGTYIDTILNAFGCDSVITLNLNVSNPIADFEFDQPDLCKAEISFLNTSTDYNKVLWDFGDGNTSSNGSQTHMYDQANDYLVSLTVESSELYSDSISYLVTAKDYNLYLPNSFTPNTGTI